MATVLPSSLHGLADRLDPVAVLLIVAVGEVQTGDVHAGRRSASSMFSSDSLAGPIVQTIFVFRMISSFLRWLIASCTHYCDFTQSAAITQIADCAELSVPVFRLSSSGVIDSSSCRWRQQGFLDRFGLHRWISRWAPPCGSGMIPSMTPKLQQVLGRDLHRFRRLVRLEASFHRIDAAPFGEITE